MDSEGFLLLPSGWGWLCRMHLRIQVDIHSLQGTVCTWVPPPPNDRLWFGFITPPDLKAEATPILTNDVSNPRPQHNAYLSCWICSIINESLSMSVRKEDSPQPCCVKLDSEEHMDNTLH